MADHTLTALLKELVANEVQPDPPGLAPGDVVGKFEIVREIGRGGFGVVYEAHDRELDRPVAFKALRPGRRALQDAGLLAEAETSAKFSHPNIVQLYDFGRSESGGHLIMELLRGETLAERLARGKPPVREAVRIALDVARALAHAHAHGVVHRDLKPGNVFLTEDGQVKVLDFGLALVLGKPSTSGGTLGYMAPEQLRGEAGDASSDVFALGVVLHELVTGQRPFPSDAPERGVPSGVRPPPLPRTPAAVSRLAGRMMAREPAERLPDGKAAVAALEAIHRTLQPARRAAMAAWAVAGVALVAAIAAAVWPRPEPLPPGRLVVALGDVENATGEPALDDVAALLGKSLEQSPRVALLARSRLLEPGGGRLAGEVIARAAGAARAHAFLRLAARTVPAGIELAARGFVPGHDQPLFLLRETAATVAAIPVALDALSARIRQGLREAPGAPQPAPLATIVSANPEAWRLYAEGKRLLSEGKPGASKAFASAVELDPEFPLPHMELAILLQFTDRDAVERHVEAALRHPERLPALERRLADAVGSWVRWDFTLALERFDAIIADFPEAPEPYQLAASFAWFVFGDLGMARPYFERLLAMKVLPAHREILALLRFGTPELALARAERFAREQPGPLSLTLLSHVRRFRGEPREALEAARAAVSAGQKPSHHLLIWAYVDGDALGEVRVDGTDRASYTASYRVLGLQGRWREALEAYDRLRPGPQAPLYLRGYHHNLRADLIGRALGPDAVWKEVEAQFRLGCGAISCSSITLAAAGDLERAVVLDGMWPMLDRRMACRRILAAHRAWKGQGPSAGLAVLEGFVWAGVDFLRGEMLLELGRNREAVEAFRRSRREMDVDDLEALLFEWPRSLHLEAIALDRVGDRAGALALMDRLVKLWANADDLPAVREARAFRSKLAAERQDPGRTRGVKPPR